MSGSIGSKSSRQPDSTLLSSPTYVSGSDNRKAPLRTIILSLAEADTITEEFVVSEQTPVANRDVDGGPNTTSGTADEGNDDASDARDGWETYYDNNELALTLRGWWLRKDGCSWLLRVPVLIAGLPQGIFTEISVPEDILDWVGLEQHAKAMRSGEAKSIGKLLRQVGVVPFARFRRLRRTVGLLKNKSGEGNEVEVVLDRVNFDIKYAENAAVSKMLFTYGSEAYRHLEAAVADFSLPTSSRSAAPRDDNEELLLESAMSTIKSHGLERWEPARGLCPRLLAYMWAMRPAHLRQLTRVGAVPPWTPPGVPASPKLPSIPDGSPDKCSKDDVDMVE